MSLNTRLCNIWQEERKRVVKDNNILILSNFYLLLQLLVFLFQPYKFNNLHVTMNYFQFLFNAYVLSIHILSTFVTSYFLTWLFFIYCLIMLQMLRVGSFDLLHLLKHQILRPCFPYDLLWILWCLSCGCSW